MTFPLIGSAVLLGLFLLFKFLPKELVNSVLTGYFVLLGTFATTVTILPFVEPLFSVASQKRELFARKITIPFILKVSVHFEILCSSPWCSCSDSALCLPGALGLDHDGARAGSRRAELSFLHLVLPPKALAGQQCAWHGLLSSRYRAAVAGLRADWGHPAQRPVLLRHILGFLHACDGAPLHPPSWYLMDALLFAIVSRSGSKLAPSARCPWQSPSTHPSSCYFRGQWTQRRVLRHFPCWALGTSSSLEYL